MLESLDGKFGTGVVAQVQICSYLCRREHLANEPLVVGESWGIIGLGARGELRAEWPEGGCHQCAG